MDVLVLGCGAVGGFYGAKLHQAGHRVSVVARSDYQAVRQNGIHIESIWGDFHFRPHRVVRSVAEFAASGSADVILVALKVLPEINVPALIAPAMAAGTAVCLLQNGIDIEPPVARRFPNNPVISGLAFTCIHRIGPGRIRHLDYGRLTLGLYPKGRRPLVTALAEAWRAAGVPVKESPEILRDRWAKLIWNAAFNPISVLGGAVTTREIMDAPEARWLAEAVMREVCRLAAACGHELPPDAVQKNLEATEAMTPYKTSMCLDFEAGRPLETEAILGNAVRLARTLEPPVPVPHIETLYGLLRLIDARTRRQRQTGS